MAIKNEAITKLVAKNCFESKNGAYEEFTVVNWLPKTTVADLACSSVSCILR